MTQALQKHPSTFGPAFDPKLDGERLEKQHERIRNLMQDGLWRTLSEISNMIDAPEASCSAQLRHLRKPEFGSYRVDKQRRGKSGTWEYRMRPPAPPWEGAEQLTLL